jgi:hypothetical protein
MAAKSFEMTRHVGTGVKRGRTVNTYHEGKLIIPATFGITPKQPRALLKGDP